jgi:SAM-dependent methyltransferase
LAERARNDLNERCMHWMRTVLKYRLPPAQTLELGSGHGGFVALMRWAGFDGTGLELSPSLVEYAKATFGVPMITGKIEDQKLEPRSLDVILHFDVLEHLPDPLSTMRHSFELLKPDGLMILQTPRFPSDRSYAEMVREQHGFLEQFKPAEHLYMFSESSIRRFFSDLGAPFIYFEPAIFYRYDMFVVASPRERVAHSVEQATEALLSRPQGRIIQALLDANTQYEQLMHRYRESESDRQARLQLLHKADEQIKAIEADCQAIEADRQAAKQVVSEIDDSYKLQMSSTLGRLLRRLQGLLKMDSLYKAIEKRVASRDRS